MDKRIQAAGIAALITTIALVVVATLLIGGTPKQDSMKVYAELSPQAKALYFKQSDGLKNPVPQRLVELDQLTIGCFGTSTIKSMSVDDANLGGQCCGALTDVHAYEHQLSALDSFLVDLEAPDYVPRDPYDIPVESAKALLAADEIQLEGAHLETYNAALEVSHHGPCCCKCWKWYVMSGLAKRLIIEEDWQSQQIADLWDLSSSCGHAEDTDLEAHYRHNH